MTPKLIAELAKQAGFQSRGDVIRTMHSSGAWVGVNEELQRFYELVRNKVLEEAANKCESLDEDSGPYSWHYEIGSWNYEIATQNCASAIRSMK